MKISGGRLADYVKTLHQKACRTYSTIIYLHSTNQIIDLSRCRWHCRCQILNSLIGGLARTKATATTTQENSDLIGWTRKNNRAARVARTLEQFFDVVCQMTAWNSVSKFKVLMTTWTHRSLYLLQLRFYRSICSLLCQQLRMRGRSYKQKIVGISQMLIFKWRFRRRRFFLSTLM